MIDSLSPVAMILGIFFSACILAFIVAVLFRINRFIRTGMKRTGDDWVMERHKDGGNTLHAEGVYGFRHPEEHGLPLKQTQKTPNPPEIPPAPFHVV